MHSSPFPAGSTFLKAAGIKESISAEQRMFERHKRIIEANVDYIAGKTVLDLASHNGRWTYAALKAGAKFVLGIEGRQILIDRGLPGFEGIDKSRYAFICGDVYDMHELAEKACGLTHFDTVMCLGLYYHISDHYRLFRLMRQFSPSTIIIDSGFMKTEEPIVRFRLENSDDPSMAIPEPDGQQTVLAGIASIGFLMTTAKLSGYKVTTIPWKEREITYKEIVAEYLNDPARNSRRYTFRLTKIS